MNVIIEVNSVKPVDCDEDCSVPVREHLIEFQVTGIQRTITWYCDPGSPLMIGYVARLIAIGF